MISEKIFRKLVLLQCAAILAVSAVPVQAGVDVNINLGVQPRRVYVPEPVYVPAPPPPTVYVPAPPPVYVPAPPVYAPPMEAIRLDEDIQFVYPDALGFYVAVGVPYDLFYLQNSYFLFRDGRWLRAPSSRGPWVAQRNRDLPQSLRRHRLERVREFRNREYVIYSRDREHYRGKQWREPRRDAKEHRKDEKHLVKEQRKDEKRFEKEQRKDEKRYDKEQRKEEKRSEKDERREHREGRD